MKKDSEIIIQKIMAHLTDTLGDEDFQTLALELFRYQFQYNLPYKKFCQAQQKTPLTVSDWRDIPPISIQGFKALTLSCEPIEDCEAVFMTSGTTNPEKRGRHYHPTLKVWDRSMKGPFKDFVLPDRERITTLVISPTEDQNRFSSLARYLTNAVTHFGTARSRTFFTENGLDVDGVVNALRQSEETGDPVLLMGATFSYVHLLDALQEKDDRFSLPKGSRIFDTGGFKGQSREVEMEALYQQFEEIFGVKREMCINMYGMTELSSQMYDQTIRTKFSDGPVIFDKKGPAWVRTVVLDPNTLTPVQPGEIGVLAHYDLANWNSCLAVLTEDLGIEKENGFKLLGRIKGSEARGCSIAVDQLLSANAIQG
ncbi:coenzyme F390 synthetase [Tuberibacillus calidus]|uniref:LuxE/PaaK family acyltransferase n=1 Tax=Tuberibacillus calidus TaxID=340097 RepID=UPI00041CB1F4|nr:coenzyme F390 synthetase [Tuberibacillus calidus]